MPKGKKQRDPRKDLSNYDPILLASVELVDRYWPAAEPFLRKCVDNAMHGEMTVDDIKAMVLAGHMYAMVLKSDKFETAEVKFVIILEVLKYPQFSTLNIVAIGGENLRMLMKRYWGYVCGWAYMIGIRRIECSVSEPMERILQSAGFNRTYIRMQQNLGVPNVT